MAIILSRLYDHDPRRFVSPFFSVNGICLPTITWQYVCTQCGWKIKSATILREGRFVRVCVYVGHRWLVRLYCILGSCRRVHALMGLVKIKKEETGQEEALALQNNLYAWLDSKPSHPAEESRREEGRQKVQWKKNCRNKEIAGRYLGLSFSPTYPELSGKSFDFPTCGDILNQILDVQPSVFRWSLFLPASTNSLNWKLYYSWNSGKSDQNRFPTSNYPLSIWHVLDENWKCLPVCSN